jgi:hypothetical protein
MPIPGLTHSEAAQLTILGKRMRRLDHENPMNTTIGLVDGVDGVMEVIRTESEIVMVLPMTTPEVFLSPQDVEELIIVLKSAIGQES